MTCEWCKRPERHEYLREAMLPGPPPRLAMVCRRCRLPVACQAYWDAMHAAEVRLMDDPERPGAISELREARQAFDLKLRGVGKPPRRRRR